MNISAHCDADDTDPRAINRGIGQIFDNGYRLLRVAVRRSPLSGLATKSGAGEERDTNPHVEGYSTCEGAMVPLGRAAVSEDRAEARQTLRQVEACGEGRRPDQASVVLGLPTIDVLCPSLSAIERLVGCPGREG